MFPQQRQVAAAPTPPVTRRARTAEEMTLERVLTALKDLRDGNFRRRLILSGDGVSAELATVFNELAERDQTLVGGLVELSDAVGRGEWPSEGLRMSGPPGSGWELAANSVNGLLEGLLGPVSELSRVLSAVAAGDLSQRMPQQGRRSWPGELAWLSGTVNGLLDQLWQFASEVTRVSREVASEGRLGGQAEVPGATGTWRDVVDSVNFMADNLTAQVRNIAQVATAVASGDLTQKIDVHATGEILELKNTINTMVDRLSAFADEVTRVSREVGTEGKLGGQARVYGVAGTWRDLTDNVNLMADNLTSQVRSIATVATAVAGGDLSKKITVEAKGEVAALAATINQMVDTLRAFADEVTRVAREVGTDGILGGQAHVPNVAGTWKDLTENVNLMARNLTSQVRNIAQVTTAVANGDLSTKIDVDARGEILELKTTINTMVDRLSAFADEVTRVAREVGTEGKLGSQAEVVGVSGTWERLTARVNHLASNLTTQVRAIAAVATAVTNGDLTRQITVETSGEVAELKDNINQMIENLKETTRTNEEQDWLKTNLARISGLMQGQHNLNALGSLIMSELVPLVSGQYGAFFLAHTEDDDTVALERTATYGVESVDTGSAPRFRLGESLVGQAAQNRETILMQGAPNGYIRISSGLGTTRPVNVIVLPVLFEDQVLGVLELASVNQFTQVHRDLLEQLRETIGVNVNTILANSRTEELLTESQHLAHELQARSEQLQRQQEELRLSNTELEEKAALLASRNRDIEVKNIEIERARQELEERARQLSLASKYKSEFLANMSHELRTPLNSALLLAKLLADNTDGNLTSQQVELANTIHSASSDLLQLINDVLDLSKVESGHMGLLPVDVELGELARHLASLYEPLADEKGLEFAVVVTPSCPATIETDKSRLEQVLRNLLSNAIKFTDEGSVRLDIRPASSDELTDPGRPSGQCLAFVVQDTGIGIPEDKLSVIFEAFQQVDGTVARKHGGTGLGLSISRELAALLGGELTVNSEQGQGSTFTLYLPIDLQQREPATIVAPATRYDDEVSRLDEAAGDLLDEGWQLESEREEVLAPAEEAPLVDAEVPDSMTAPDSPEASGPAEAARGTATEAPRFDGEKVLIVDDDLRGVYALTTLLERQGLSVLHADNGLAGLRALRHHDDIQAVLMDLMMPELDGTAAIAAIRTMPDYQELPIITVTAKAMKGDRERSLAAGATDHVTKPVDIQHLLRLLAHHLGQERTSVEHS